MANDVGIGKDVLFGLDNFHKPMMKSANDALAQSILNILFMKPGQLPSQPHVGVNISKYLYEFGDELESIRDEIVNNIQNQCRALSRLINVDGIQMAVINHEGQDIMMLVIPVIGETNIVYAFSKKNDTVLFNYKFNKDILG